MPKYIYENEAGDRVVERHYEREHAPSKVLLNGVPYWRKVDCADCAAEGKSFPSRGYRSWRARQPEGSF